MPAMHHGSRSRALRWLWWGPPAALALFLAAFAWDAYQLLASKDELTSHARAAKQALTDRDAEELLAEAAALEESARRFATATAGPHWWIAARIPWVADQTVPLQRAGAAVEAVASEALSPLAELDDLSALSAPEFVDGRIDPYLLEPHRETLAQAAEVLTAQTATLASTDVAGAVTAVREPFAELRDQLADLADLVNGAHVAAEVLPSMLGGDGERRYLVMVQNNAEPRTTGGIPGAVLEISVADGEIALERYATANSMIDRDGPVTLTADELRVFTRRMEVYPQNVNFTPEYPRSAQLMSEFWRAEYGTVPDGVLSIDPVALGYMLEGAPETEVGQFSISGANLADVMLRDSYLEFPEPEDQDAFFARASAVLFSVMVGGQSDPIGGIERAIDESRFMAWSGDAREQELLASTVVGGTFLDQGSTLGVFINDGSGAKIGYYVDVETTVVSRVCADGTLVSQTATVELAHQFDGDVDELPWYVATGAAGYPNGEFHANVRLFPATGTGVVGATRDGETTGVNPERLDGRALSTVRVVLTPGDVTELTFEIVANEAEIREPELAITPGPKPNVYSTTSVELVDNC